MTVFKLIRLTIGSITKPMVKYYLNKDRMYRYNSIKISVFKGVFHPGMFYSTKILLNYLKEFDLSGKKTLELGAGSGLISVFAAKKMAQVTASDISKAAIENVLKNAEDNNVNVIVIHSNLFENIPDNKFDFIIINPPYYKKKPLTEPEYAWYCGEHSEYFQNLFKEMSRFIHEHSKIIMVLSEDCDLKEINFLAEQNNFAMQLKKKYIRLFEMNYVFEIHKINGSNC